MWQQYNNDNRISQLNYLPWQELVVFLFNFGFRKILGSLDQYQVMHPRLEHRERLQPVGQEWLPAVLRPQVHF